MKPAPRRRGQWILLVLVVLIGFGLRLHGLGRRDLWGDERIAVSVATGGFRTRSWPGFTGEFTPADVWSRNTLRNVLSANNEENNGNGVLYISLLHLWIRVFGPGDAAVRFPSVLFGTFTLPPLYLLGRRWFGRRVALVATALAAVFPIFLRYSQETRFYAMALFFSLAATCWFVRLLDPATKIGRREWGIYGALVGVSLLTHYFTGYVFLGHLVYAALRRRREVLAALARAWLLAALPLAAWMALGGYEGMAVYGARADRVLAELARAPQGGRFVWPATWWDLATGWGVLAMNLTGNYLGSGGMRHSLAALFLVAPAVLIALAWREAAGRPERRAALQLAGVLILTPVPIATALCIRSGHTLFLTPRYHLFVSPYVVLALALGCWGAVRARGPARGLGLAALAVQGVVTAISVGYVYSDRVMVPPRLPNPYPELARRIRAEWRPGDRVIYTSWFVARQVNLYLPPDAPIRQRLEEREPGDAVWIQRASGERILLGRVPRESRV